MVLISASEVRRLGGGSSYPVLKFGTPDPAVPGRILSLAGAPAFELSDWCGTCKFLFRRRAGANRTLSGALGSFGQSDRALDVVDDQVLATISQLLPKDEYLPLLLEVRPELVAPGDDRDYFTHEQIDTWGVEKFWGLPHDPRSFYYRTFQTAVGGDAHLYEFVVPMVPPSWNDRDRVDHYRCLLRSGETPTAVALSTLDVCRPATDGEATDSYSHWGLSHFLLDGHHKVEAAADTGTGVRLLAVVSIGGSLARTEDIARLSELLTQPHSNRACG